MFSRGDHQRYDEDLQNSIPLLKEFLLTNSLLHLRYGFSGKKRFEKQVEINMRKSEHQVLHHYRKQCTRNVLIV